MNYIIGTRGSPLAIRQANHVADLLTQSFPQHQFSLEVIQTKGDRIQNVALDKMNDKGIFVKEIEGKLSKGEIHMAVHSMKDMPSQLPAGLCFTKALKGEDVRDVWISSKNQDFSSLHEFARIGTGSKRRAYQLKQIYENVEICPIRGNVDTRLRKMVEEDMDGIILAAAGLHRLAKFDQITTYLDPCTFVPACCQGVLAIEVKQDQMDILSMLEQLHDPLTESRVLAERAFLASVDGGCHIPVGAYLKIEKDHVCLYGVLGNEDGSMLVKGNKTGLLENAFELGMELAKELLEKRGELHHG